MAQQFELSTELEDIESPAPYFDKVLIDAAGMDFYLCDDSTPDSSVSFEGIDRHLFAYAVLGDEKADFPNTDSYRELYAEWASGGLPDEAFEEIAHAALRILAERSI